MTVFIILVNDNWSYFFVFGESTLLFESLILNTAMVTPLAWLCDKITKIYWMMFQGDLNTKKKFQVFTYRAPEQSGVE